MLSVFPFLGPKRAFMLFLDTMTPGNFVTSITLKYLDILVVLRSVETRDIWSIRESLTVELMNYSI